MLTVSVLWAATARRFLLHWRLKATLDATGLQCSEFEADTSKQVFTGLQLDHKTGILSLEASRIWRLGRGLEFAAHQKHLTGDQLAKLIGHFT